MKAKNPAKELYQQLRQLSCARLWEEEVPIFDQADARGRLKRVAVVRAVGVVFSESGTADEKEQARQWVLSLLDDPEEKVRRYAMAALPKLGAAAREESALHSLLGQKPSERETKFLAKALEKIGGDATLRHQQASTLPQSSLQKLEANRLRHEQPGQIQFETSLEEHDLHIRLECKAGLEEFVADELHDAAAFRIVHTRPGAVTISPQVAFSLSDLYRYRCFAEASFQLGRSESADVESLATIIASSKTQRILASFTAGPIRYRLEFTSRGHRRGAVRELAAAVYRRNPRLLNDSRGALWQIDIHESHRGAFVSVRPRLRPDPRFSYRMDDVPAASHPPLAACLVRLAGSFESEIAWDPFCGSGLELIERARFGGVEKAIGTDISEDAIRIAEANFAAAAQPAGSAHFVCRDFRDYRAITDLRKVSLIITNPPLGRRVPIPNLPQLLEELFAIAGEILIPGGRLVLVNPLRVRPARGSALREEYRRRIDLGGFHCHLEKYVIRGRGE